MSDTSTADRVSIEGQWLLEYVVVGDTIEVRPTDVDPEPQESYNGDQ